MDYTDTISLPESSCYDENTPSALFTKLLRGIEDGDPAILDGALSGQWSDTLIALTRMQSNARLAE